jgi:hypothetical protein
VPVAELPITSEALAVADEALSAKLIDEGRYLDINEDDEKALIQAFLEAEGFEIDDDNGHNSMRRLIGPWRAKSGAS